MKEGNFIGLGIDTHFTIRFDLQAFTISFNIDYFGYQLNGRNLKCETLFSISTYKAQRLM